MKTHDFRSVIRSIEIQLQWMSLYGLSNSVTSDLELSSKVFPAVRNILKIEDHRETYPLHFHKAKAVRKFRITLHCSV